MTPAIVMVTVFGARLCDATAEGHDAVAPEEAERLRRWNAAPRELKLAVARVHDNLGHPALPSLLRV